MRDRQVFRLRTLGMYTSIDEYYSRANKRFSAYPLASLGHAAWILRHYSYKAVFIWGLCLYAVGALIAIPCIKAKSFAGFCMSIFIIGNGLGSLETAANPFITGMLSRSQFVFASNICSLRSSSIFGNSHQHLPSIQRYRYRHCSRSRLICLLQQSR